MKRIVITGAGSGLGAEIAKCYGEEGNHILLIGRSQSNLQNVAEEIIKRGGKADCFLCDISYMRSIEKLVQMIVDKYEGVDYLINNAGVGCFGPLSNIKDSDIDKMIDVNVKGTIFVTKSFLPYINERIINIVSTAGLRGKVNETVYCASKFGVRGFTESLQKELEDSNIKVTGVYMGGMDTPFWNNTNHIKDKSRLMSPEYVARQIKAQDDGRAEIIIESSKE